MSKLFTSISTWIKFLVSLRNSSLAQIVLDLWQGGLLEAFEKLKSGEISIEGFVASLPDWVRKLFEAHIEQQVSTQVAEQVAAKVTAHVDTVTAAVSSAVSDAVAAVPSASDIAKAVVAEVAQSGIPVTAVVPVVASVSPDSTGYASPTLTPLINNIVSGAIVVSHADTAAVADIADAMKNASSTVGTSLLEKIRL